MDTPCEAKRAHKIGNKQYSDIYPPMVLEV